MTAQAQTDSLQQLHETVTQLANALSASERRHAAMARTVRWGALAITTIMVTLAYISSDIFKAYASQVGFWDQVEKQISAAPPQLDGIMMSLMQTKELNAALVKVMQSASQIATVETPGYVKCTEARENGDELCYASAAVEDLGEYFLDEQGQPPMPPATNDPMNPEYQQYMKKLMEGTFMAAGQTLIDGAVLVHRLRRGSDFLRGKVINQMGGTNELLKGIRDELSHMNGMMMAIPAMATEMNAMNRHMSVMSHGVGSTMGRMGNIMPW